ncbi:36216_t:CDS:1, partial [Gigaspora margarita]
MLGRFDDYFIKKNWVLQQDNDPKHMSDIATNYFDDNNIVVMDWSSYSLDLNPIENLWSIIKTKIEHHRPKNLEKLELYMKQEWTKVPQHVLIRLANIMQERYQAV